MLREDGQLEDQTDFSDDEDDFVKAMEEAQEAQESDLSNLYHSSSKSFNPGVEHLQLWKRAHN